MAYKEKLCCTIDHLQFVKPAWQLDVKKYNKLKISANLTGVAHFMTPLTYTNR